MPEDYVADDNSQLERDEPEFYPPVATRQANPMPTVHTLLSWHAPGRPFRKRGKEFFSTSLLLVLFIEIIAFLFHQYMLMLVIGSLMFVVYALYTVPPKDFHYRISTEGITIEDHFYLWQELYDFYFKHHDNIDTLHIRTEALIPGELIIPLGPIEKEHVKQVLLAFLPYREVVKPTFMEKSGSWLSKNFPLERQHKSTPQNLPNTPK